ncbi:MAG: hypothetical protein G01um101431_139 [Parcubacteria group bacterium Gr01-1014_31]|nr:MAG: hypothetical protein G01um101431_139 [Parcubacteria group bacterium Gr01-1014_31]
MPDQKPADIIRGLLWINLIAGFILYITYYHQLEGALEIIRNITPPLIFLAGMILAFSRDRSIIRRHRVQGEETETIVISYRDAMLHDAISFLTAMAIVVVPTLASKDGISLIDIIQAALAFLALSYLRTFYFGKVYR